MEVPGRIGSVNVEVGQNFGTLVVGDHNIIQISGVAAPVVVPQSPDPLHRPTEVQGFLDRRVETARALEALQPGSVLELVGPQRIGKSTLARHAAFAAAANFRDGALLLPPGLAGARDALQSLFEMFYRATPEMAPSATRLREYLGAKNALVIIDHCELSQQDLPMLQDAARGCALLVVGSTPSLNEPGARIELGGLPTEDALALMERVHGAPLGSALVLKALAQCEEFKGHPQALIDAARALGNNPPPRYAPLSEDERALLLTLRLFAPRAVPRDVIAELSGLPRAAELAGALVTRGLLHANGSGFQVLPAQPADQPPEELRMANQADAMVRVGRAAAANPARRRKLLAALPLLWATLALARERGAWRCLLALGAAWHGPLALGGRWDALARLLDAHLVAARQLGDGVAEAWTLHQDGTRELALSHIDRARSLFEQSREVGALHPDAALQAATRDQLELIRTLAPLPADPVTQQAAQLLPTPTTQPAVALKRTAWLKTGALVAVGGVAVLGAALAWWLIGAPKLEVDATRVDFEPVILGAATLPASKAVRLRNSGRRALTLASVRAEPPFRVDANGCTSTPLAAGASCTLRVHFEPAARGAARGALAIAGERLSVPTVALEGRALAGVLAVQERVDFGAIDIGTPVASRSLVVENRGDAPLRLQPLPVLNAPFALANDGCRAGPLAPGESCSIELRYRAAAGGRHEAKLVLSSDEPGGAPRSVTLTAEGRAAALELALRELHFDAVEVGQRSAVQRLRVRNAGNAPLRLAVSPVGAGAAPFEINAAGCAAPIAPGESCELQVVFAPGAPPGGLRESVLKLAAPSLPAQNVRLSARVTAPVLILQPAAHDFGQLAWPPSPAAAAAGEQTFVIGNNGEAPLRFARLAAAPKEFQVVANDCPAALAPQNRCRVTVRFVPSSAARVFNGQLSVAAAHLPAGAVQLSGSARAAPLPVPVLLSPAADGKLQCADDRRIRVPFSWRIDPMPAESLQFQFNAGFGDPTEANASGTSRSFTCPAVLKWSVRATAADGRTSDSETRVLTLVARPVVDLTPPVRLPGGVREAPPPILQTIPERPPTRVPGTMEPRTPSAPATQVPGTSVPRTPSAPATQVPGTTTRPRTTDSTNATTGSEAAKILRPGEMTRALPNTRVLSGSCCATTSSPMTFTTQAACSGRWWAPTQTPPATCVVVR